MPLAIVQDSVAARGRRRPTDDVDDDVVAAEAIAHGIGHGRAAFGGGDVRRDEMIGIGRIIGRGASGRQHGRTRLTPPSRHRLANALGASGDERPKTRELEVLAHRFLLN
jgi:hypothetical protein